MFTGSRCTCVAWVIAAAVLAAGCATRAAEPGDVVFSRLQDEARTASLSAWSPLPVVANERLRSLDYDQYRLIPPLPHKALWRDTGLPFEIVLYHPGYLYDELVPVHVLEADREWTVPFDAERFGYHLPGGAAEWSAGVDGHAGFLALYPFDGGPWRECVSFLGASYFRAIGSGHVYGSSARGLAIDIGPGGTESFPRFSAFWIRKPGPDNTTLEVLARLTAPEVEGAYRFEIRPGTETAMDVRAVLFARRDIDRLALAPITSMFWHGSEGRDGDGRPRVHDAEGLLLHDDAGWSWHPVENAPMDRVSRFGDGGLEGFGLMQRHRQPGDYRDAEALYHLRPSVWIEPLEGFGGGHVELLELHAQHEGVDNLGAYFVRDSGLQAGERLEAAWRVHFADDAPGRGNLAPVVDSHVERRDAGLRASIEFEVAADERGKLTAEALAGATPLPGVALRFEGNRAEVSLTAPDPPVRPLRVRLLADGAAISETWVWQHE